MLDGLIQTGRDIESTFGLSGDDCDDFDLGPFANMLTATFVLDLDDIYSSPYQINP